MSDVQPYSELNAYFWTKIVLTSATIVCAVLCIPLMHKHRQHPVLKYRTMPVYIMTIVAAFIMNILDLVTSEITGMSVTVYRFLLISYAFTDSALYGAIAGIGFRYYSLVLTRYVQGQLMDRRTCYDGVFYRRVASQIRWCRFLTNEKTAIQNAIASFLLYAVTLVTPYIVASDADIESIMKEQPSFLRMWLGIIALTVSVVSLGK